MNMAEINKDFLLEIGCEELPPKALHSMSKALGENLDKLLSAAELSHQVITCFATPRRLAVLVLGLANKQPDKLTEQRGPNINAAFNDVGEPTAACQGFAKACGVHVAALERVTDAKGTWLMAKKQRIGESAIKLLPEIVAKALKGLPIPRQMRWSEGNISFVRPVHWVVMLYGNEVVEGTILGVPAGNKTYGHRFHHPEAIIIPEPAQYEELLRSQGFVVADLAKRKAAIASDAKLQVGKDSTIVIDEHLLEEVASITEWPIVLVGRFDQRFLVLPKELLILVLQKQQRCFPVMDAHGNLTAYFVTVSNIASRQPEVVIRGNENVILARFTDAEFFYKADMQTSLDSHFPKLQKTVFQTGLGTIYEKTLRLVESAGYIAGLVKADVAAVKLAAKLSKTDLMTTLVGEFPELQGIAGSYYAAVEKQPAAAVAALRDQYLPTFAADQLPQTLEGCALSLADRIDTLVGIFSLGKIPTGERDPFALRRAAFGVLRIIIEKQLDLDVYDLIRRSLKQYLVQVDKFDEVIIKNYQVPSQEQEKTLEEIAVIVVDKVMEFVFERERSWCLEEGCSNSTFDAVRALQPAITRPLDFMARIQAIKYFQTIAEAQALSAAHKRVKNILADAAAQDQVTTSMAGVGTRAKTKVGALGKGKNKKAQVAVSLPSALPKESFATPDPKRLQEDAEIDLAAKIAQATQLVDDFCAASQYKEALKEMAKLKGSIDYFFNTVMVMVDDAKLRANRLALLKQLRDLFHRVADISYLSV
jgi:glycyl-tRNA synthetase beta chain